MNASPSSSRAAFRYAPCFLVMDPDSEERAVFCRDLLEDAREDSLCTETQTEAETPASKMKDLYSSQPETNMTSWKPACSRQHKTGIFR